MLVLVRNGNDVFYNDEKLRIVKQASKGLNMEVVDIDGLEGSNGQKWIMLKNLKEGSNELTGLKGREVVISSKIKYELTKEEQEKVNALQSKIDEIVELAKSRYVEKPNFNINPNNLTQEQREEHAQKIEKYLEYLRNGGRV